MTSRSERSQIRKGASLPLTHIQYYLKILSMSRPLRIENPEALYNVMNRARRIELIF